MDAPTPDDDLLARLDHLELRIEDLHAKVGNSQKSGGGIGCLGVVLFVIVFIKLGDILEAVRAIPS